MYPATQTYPEVFHMASPTLLRGVVTHVDRLTNLSGDGRGIGTDHSMVFRIDQRAVLYEGYADLTIGDPATAAGRYRNGQFRALAVRNDTTHLVYGRTMTGALVLAGIFLFIALISMPFGVVPLIGGGWLGHHAWHVRQAREMLRGGRNASPGQVLA